MYFVCFHKVDWMQIRGAMGVRNCVVIVWLLYGYCMVRAGKVKNKNSRK